MYWPVIIGANNSQNCSNDNRRTSMSKNDWPCSRRKKRISFSYLVIDRCIGRRYLYWFRDENVYLVDYHKMLVDDFDDRHVRTIRTWLKYVSVEKKNINDLCHTFDHFTIDTFGILSIFLHNIISNFIIDYLHDLPILGLMGYWR